MVKHKTSGSLNQQIHQLEQQMIAARSLQQQHQQHVQHLLTTKLTPWPLVLGAITAGFLVHQFALSPASKLQPLNSLSQSTTANAAIPKPVASWRTLLSLPFLTQIIFWLLELMWHRGIAAHSVIKSSQRHPLYDTQP